MFRKNLIKFNILALSLIVLVSCESAVRFTSNDDFNSEGKSKSKKTATKIPGKTHYEDDHLSLSGKQEKVINEAEKWLGTPYCFGGIGNGCIDCSAYVQTVYEKSVGIHLPRTAAEQYDALQVINEKDARAGDLVFFKKKEHITHVGIYLGHNRFIHSSSSRGVVKQELNGSLTFAGFKRVL